MIQTLLGRAVSFTGRGQGRSRFFGVEAGAVLATIEDPALPAGSLEAKAAVASAQAAKAAADQELARQERLVSSGIGARRDREEPPCPWL